MNCSSPSEVRRCRPLLGTFVAITAAGLDETRLDTAVNAAFGAIEDIERRMSVHDPSSEIARLNREAYSHPVAVSAETFEVLGRAERLAAESDGAFDHTIAPTLARWGLLPKALARKKPGGWRSVSLLRDRRVLFLQPLAVDLGGIAKGFAVDTAIGSLRRSGVVAAVVNAGGDLRVFGPKPETVHLRHPSAPQLSAQHLEILNASLATSAPYFTERRWRGRRVSHLVNPRDRSAVTGGISVSVRADECWLADALTKVVLNSPRLAERVLAQHHAEAFVLTA